MYRVDVYTPKGVIEIGTYDSMTEANIKGIEYEEYFTVIRSFKVVPISVPK
jgi:hypothetical protein